MEDSVSHPSADVKISNDSPTTTVLVTESSTSNEEIPLSSSSSASSSSPASSSTSKGFVVVKKVEMTETTELLPNGTSSTAASLGRTDAPNHVVVLPQQQQQAPPPSNLSFLQRLRTTRQALSIRANDVITAATPALSIAGQVVKTAATHAAVVAATSFESYEATTTTTMKSDNIPPLHNPYDSVVVEKDDTSIIETTALADNNATTTTTTTTTTTSETSSSFRGRYANPSSPPFVHHHQHHHQQQRVTNVTNSILNHAFGLPPKANSTTGRQPPPPLSRSNSTTSTVGLLPTSPFKETTSAGTRSQTALILQSSAGPHMHSILSSLEPFEHVMLLGPGIMGVNLKDCYNGGVYVDLIVPNGNAEKSGVVQIGDILVKVGDVNVRKLSIKEVPQLIAKQPRPTVIVLTRKHLYPSAESTNCPPSPVDKALETVLEIQHRVKDGRERSIASMPLETLSPSIDDVAGNDDDDDDDEESSVGTGLGSAATDDDRSRGSFLSSDSFLSPISTTRKSSANPMSKTVQRSLAAYASRRHMEMSFYTAIKRAHGEEPFCTTMKRGLRAVCADARCLPYFASHLTKEAIIYDSNSTASPATSPNSAKLMLLLEILAFHELWALTPPSRRLTHALRVAHKFMIPIVAESEPIFDLRSEIPQNILEELEQALGNTDPGSISRDIFLPVQNHFEQYFCGMHFSSFIMGENFARMRAYISGSPTYSDVPLEDLWDAFLEQNNADAQKYMHFIMIHLCTSELNRGAGLAAACYIKRTTTDDENEQQPLSTYQHLWDVYLNPVGGTLAAFSKKMTSDASVALENAREQVLSILSKCDKDNVEKKNEALKQSLLILANELIYEYAANVYPRFKMDRLHDLLFREVVSKNDIVPKLNKGCIARLLRSAKFPRSISSHRPHRIAVSTSTDEQLTAANSQMNCNAEFAVIFGSDLMKTGRENSPTIRRFSAAQVGEIVQPLENIANGAPRVQSVQELPVTLEDYAAFNPGLFMKRAMRNSQRVCTSDDGWEVYLSNFTVPNGSVDHPSNCLYGVSLVLHRSRSPAVVHDGNEPDELAASQENSSSSPMFQAIAVEGAERYLTFDIVHKVDQIFKEAPSPSRRHRRGPWSKEFLEGGPTVGISLIANSNVIPAMRQSLSDFFKGLSSWEQNGACVAGLADLLGSYSSPSSSESTVDLPTVLRPYIESGSKEWIHRPMSEQAAQFEDQCICHILECLSPTAFCLAFLTVLLEQKVVFVSSRRSTLLSAATAFSKLLAPLEWPHLTVPIVPSNLAVDLIQYPAPFLIGLCSKEKDNQDIFNFPKDVTVIELDLGRVMLGDNYASAGDSKGASAELRLQVIYLAEELGACLGSILSPEVWRCEDPFYVCNNDEKEKSTVNVSGTVRTLCQEFITELTEGVDSCCMWIEEGDSDMNQEGIVLFDEDRFFHLKDLRSKKRNALLLAGELSSIEAINKFAIGLDDFDLLLETFLRGQAMSVLISSREKKSMTYW